MGQESRTGEGRSVWSQESGWGHHTGELRQAKVSSASERQDGMNRGVDAHMHTSATVLDMKAVTMTST